MFYRLTKAVLTPLFKLLFRFQVEGADNLPDKGRVVLVANHASYLDPVAIGIAAPRPVAFIAKEELFRIPVLGWICRMLYAIPVRREIADREAIREAVRLVKGGMMVGIFPQGTREKEGISQIMPGAALIAYKAGAVVVPAAVAGTGKVLPPGSRRPRLARIKVSFGPPIEIAPGVGRKEVVAQTTETIAEKITALLGESCE